MRAFVMGMMWGSAFFALLLLTLALSFNLAYHPWWW